MLENRTDLAARAPSVRSERFNGLSKATVLRTIPQELHPKAAEILSSGEKVRTRMRETYEKHRERWVDKAFGKLLTRQESAPSPRPVATLSVNSMLALRARAERLVSGRQARRIARVSQAETRRLRELLPYKRQFARAAGLGRGE